MDEKEDVSQNELCRDEESQSLTVYIETFEDQNSKSEDIEIILDNEESAKSIFVSLKTFHSMEIHESKNESLHSYESNSIGTLGFSSN